MRIPLLYLAIATLWIIFSDRAVEGIFSDSAESTVQTFKGVGFVLFTSLGLYALLQIELSRRRNAEDHLHHLGQIENLAVLTGGITHNVNNIIAVILMNAELAGKQTQDKKMLKRLGNIVAHAHRCRTTLNEFLALGRKTDTESAIINPQDLIQELGRLVHETFPKVISFGVNVQGFPSPIYGNRQQIFNVLLNLCVNARDAMPKGGALTIGVRNQRFSKSQSIGQRQLAPGTYVIFTLSDTGHGIHESVRDKLFTPFVTTKPKGNGTGLGLSSSLRIVAEHGGAIDVSTEKDKGTHFQIFFPALYLHVSERQQDPPSNNQRK